MDFCVYLHRKKTNNEIFYVGKGKKHRPYQKSSRNAFWRSVVSKHGYIVEIVESGLQEWYALELETDLINLYGKRQDGDGILVNLADGGAVGTTGYKMSEETKQLIRIKALARPPHPNLKRKRPPKTAEHRAKISKKNKGKKRTDETRKRISEARKGYKVPPEVLLKTSISKSDPTVYKLQHESGDIFVGTRRDFTLKYNVNIKPLFQKNPPVNGKAKGWRIVNG